MSDRLRTLEIQLDHLETRYTELKRQVDELKRVNRTFHPAQEESCLDSSIPIWQR